MPFKFIYIHLLVTKSHNIIRSMAKKQCMNIYQGNIPHKCFNPNKVVASMFVITSLNTLDSAFTLSKMMPIVMYNLHVSAIIKVFRRLQSRIPHCAMNCRLIIVMNFLMIFGEIIQK